MYYFKKSVKIFNSKGVITLIKKTLTFFSFKVRRKTKIFEKYLYSALAKILSPVKYQGILIPTSSNVFDADVRSRFITGKYEHQEVKAIKKHVKEPHEIIDLGASTGFLTVFLIKMFDYSPCAVAVEGNKKMIPILKRVRQINGVNFEIESSAYHSTLNTVNFNIHHLTVGGSVQRETDNKERVEAISLEKITKKYELEKFICVADIEGGEADLINNELNIIEEKCVLLFVEFHEGYAEGVKEAKQKLKSSSMRMVDNVGGIHVYRSNKL